MSRGGAVSNLEIHEIYSNSESTNSFKVSQRINDKFVRKVMDPKAPTEEEVNLNTPRNLSHTDAIDNATTSA